MTRHALTFRCQGALCAASLDTALGRTGLLIVSGGNAGRAGPWGSQARLAQRIAAAGFPVLRFDRRGVGDSEGINAGFEGSTRDLVAALATFRAQAPTLKQVVAFGNCDAASALMLTGGMDCAALVLANPWIFDPAAETSAALEPPEPVMSPQMLRAHYLRRLTKPRALLRLLTGKVKLGHLAASLKDAAKPSASRSVLAQQMDQGLTHFGGPVTILLAGLDRTAQAFEENWDAADPRLRRCPEASHSFVEPAAWNWLQDQLLIVLRAVDQPV